jgi:hypothetical protein
MHGEGVRPGWLRRRLWNVPVAAELQRDECLRLCSDVCHWTAMRLGRVRGHLRELQHAAAAGV